MYSGILSKKYLGIDTIFIAKEAFHGITLKTFREQILNFKDISIIEFEMNNLEDVVNNGNTNTLLILEPFLFFSEQGYSSIRKIQTAVAIAKQHGMKVLFDEIRSGAFSTGSFLFTQKCMPVDVDFLCFSKGLALGVPTAVLAIKSGILSQNIIKKEDRLKSCMSTSEVAMQRANDLIDYYLSNTFSFNEQMAQTTERIINHFSPFSNYSFVENVNIMGLCCVFVFNRNIKKA